MFRRFEAKAVYQGSLPKGADLVKGLLEVLKEQGITAGSVSGIGALSEARIAFFNAATKKYEEKLFQEDLELVSLKGNISEKDHETFAHMHVVLSRRDFSAVGGHLFTATVYAFEFEIVPFEGKRLVRGFDEETGLFLWKE